MKKNLLTTSGPAVISRRLQPEVTSASRRSDRRRSRHVCRAAAAVDGPDRRSLIAVARTCAIPVKAGRVRAGEGGGVTVRSSASALTPPGIPASMEPQRCFLILSQSSVSPFCFCFCFFFFFLSDSPCPPVTRRFLALLLQSSSLPLSRWKAAALS